MRKISKVVNYVWVGGGEKSDFINACIHDWSKMLPQFKIVEWSEKNIELEKIINESPFIKKCYEKKMWAFVSDYIRMKVLYENGGIYLDTDITIVKDLTPLLEEDFFIGKENEDYISAGVIGCKPKSIIIKKIIDFYQKEAMMSELYTLPMIITCIFERNPEFYKIAKVYEPKYFYPYYYNEHFTESCLTEKTYTIHWWGKNWGNPKGTVFLKTKSLHGIYKIMKAIKLTIYSYINK
ncbi:glycosyltransferase family 32 protein [Aliivibrio fischeri]|uniref:glycosyltransferase family 32 protein n=1 Tax=Aliivibrio fischeri TaxID=668 RepID=UPI0012D98888|nr:glycosyltransferase [Aliivibrio fischeri]MUI52515.1 glycosyltransferase [Aliivibrio fischeri]